jgi:transcriptional regulator with XRE-family HTH domain
MQEWRFRRAYSLRELAARSGVSYRSLALLERGRRQPRPSTRRKIAVALGVEPWQVIFPHEQDFASGVADQRGRRKKAMKIRCFCGRYMAYTGRELATYVSGGRELYSCRRCQAQAVIWHRHCSDDDPVGGFIWDAAGREAELVWDEEKVEWRKGNQG